MKSTLATAQWSVLLLIGSLPYAASAATPCNANCQSLRSEFRFVVSTGTQIYCYAKEKTQDTGLDFAQLATQMEATIQDSTTQTDYFNLLRQWAAAFHDGHVNVMPSSTGPIVVLPTSNYRFEVLNPATQAEKVIIARSGGDAALVGAEVLALNGRPVSAVLTETEKFSSGSTAPMRRAGAGRRLIDASPDAAAGAASVQLTLRANDGTQQSLAIPILHNQVSPTPPDSGSSGPSTVSAQILPGNVGYLRIDGFIGDTVRADLNRAMDQLDGTAGLLIDVRKNGGGDQSGDEVLARLITAPITRYEVSPRLSTFLLNHRPELQGSQPIPGTDFAQWAPQIVQPSHRGQGWAGKDVLVMSSPGCFSACDTFVSALQVNGLAEVGGEGTGGGTGSPLVFDLPFTQHRFRYSVVRGRTKDGNFIEGRGTLPNFVLPPTQQERQAGQDQQLQASIQHLLERVRNHGGGSRILGFGESNGPDFESEGLATLGELQLRNRLASNPAEENLSATQAEILQI